MTNEQAAVTYCPFWSDSDMRCGIYSDGIFIPLDSDIKDYCTSGNYDNCSLFCTAGSLPGKMRKKPVLPTNTFQISSQESQN